MSIIISVIPFVISGAVAMLGGATAVVAANTESANANNTQEPHLVLPTNIRNEILLTKALTNLGATNINNSSASIDGLHIAFSRTENGLFNIEFYGPVAQQDAETFASDLQNEYGRVIQEFVYTQLKQKAADKGLTIEKESIQKDQSIVLTLNLNN